MINCCFHSVSTKVFSPGRTGRFFVWNLLLTWVLVLTCAGTNVIAQPNSSLSPAVVTGGTSYPPILRNKQINENDIKAYRKKLDRENIRSAGKNEESKEEYEKDRPDLAQEQENRITRDPALGYVPRERLKFAFDKQVQQRAMRTTAAMAGAVSTATWVERGPSNVGGRTRAILFDPNDPTKKKVWAGGAGGGLWYTNDITAASPVWVHSNDFWANIAITCIAYNPANTQEMYVGTGEGFGNLDAIRGAGIWKTTNGGTTWTQLAGLSTNDDFTYVNKLAVTSGGVVFAATSSRFCNRGGIFKSTNGGTTWTLVLGTQTGSCSTSNCSSADLEIGSDGAIYATNGLWTTAGGLYKSTDVGVTWSKLNNGTNGFPNSGLARIEVAVAPSDPNRLYAMAQNSTSNALLNIYTSANGGSTWTAVTKPSWFDQNCSTPSTDMTRTQSWYDLIIAVDPNTPTTLFVGGVDVMKSTNTGSTWTQISSWCGCCTRQYMHADQHAMAYQPGSSTVMLFGNDGGIFYTSNATAATPTVADRNNGYNVTQFYSCAIHPTAGQNYFLAGAQDNGTQQFTSSGMNATFEANGGDGAFTFIDQLSPAYQISSYVYNNYDLSTNNWATSTALSASSTTGDFINPADYDDKNHILYSAYSTTQIQRITGVTTTPATTALTISGMSAMAGHLRASPYSPAGTSTVYVGTQNSQLFKVTNAQATPTVTNITGASFPPSSTISCVEIGATENDLLVTFSNYGVVSVWRTTDGGVTWSNKEGDLPDMPVRWAMYNPNNRNEVMLATELGIWSTGDITVASPTWISNNNGMANVRVDMLQLRSSDNEMIAATHGRGLFSSSVFGGPATADFSADVTTTCTNSNVVFTSNSSGSISSWSWNFGAGATPATSTSSGPVTVQYSTAGLKTISLTVNGPSGSNTQTKTAYINVQTGIGTLSVINGLATACSGAQTAYSVTPVVNATSYVWTSPVGTSILSGQGTSSCQIAFNTGGGNVTVYATNGTCNSNTLTKAVTIKAGSSSPTISPSGPALYCAGDFLQLTAAQPAVVCGVAANLMCDGVVSTATLGTGASTNTTSTYPTAYGSFYESSRQQFLFTKAELNAAGLRAGTIQSLSFNVSNVNTSGVQREYTIKLLCTAATSITTFQAGATTVFGPTTYTPVAGVNTHNLTVPFNWDGNTNLIVEICHNNDLGSTTTEWTQNASVSYTATAFTSCVLRRADNAGSQCGITTVTATSSNRPNVVFGGCTGSSGISYLWNTGSTNNPLTLTSSGNYTVVATNPSGCTNQNSFVVAPKPDIAASVKLFIQGFYTGSSTMTPVLYNLGLSTDPTAVDSVTVELREATSPYALHQSFNALLKTNGTLSVSPACDVQSHSYYIVVKTRNGIETWSKLPVLFGATTNFRFDQ